MIRIQALNDMADDRNGRGQARRARISSWPHLVGHDRRRRRERIEECCPALAGDDPIPNVQGFLRDLAGFEIIRPQAVRIDFKQWRRTGQIALMRALAPGGSLI